MNFIFLNFLLNSSSNILLYSNLKWPFSFKILMLNYCFITFLVDWKLINIPNKYTDWGHNICTLENFLIIIQFVDYAEFQSKALEKKKAFVIKELKLLSHDVDMLIWENWFINYDTRLCLLHICSTLIVKLWFFQFYLKSINFFIICVTLYKPWSWMKMC